MPKGDTSEKDVGKVLLVDTGFSALPIYNALVSDGFEVWAMSSRGTDVVAQLAGSRWIPVNYSDVETVVRIAEKARFTSIIPGCTDASYSTCVELTAFRNRDGRSAYDALNNKELFRETCTRIGVPSPIKHKPQDFPRKGLYISKPVDSFSGRGITRFDGMNEADLLSALQIAIKESRTGSAIVETYLEGNLYSFSCFLEQQRVGDWFTVREGSSVNPYAVDSSYVDYDLPRPLCDALIHSVELLAKELELSDGLFHVQFIESGGIPYFIEATRRCPGDLYSLLIELSTGYPYAAKYASYFTGKMLDARKSRKEFIIRHTVASQTQLVNQGMVFDSSVPVKAIFSLQVLGEMISGGQQSRLGIMFFDYPTRLLRSAAYEQLLGRSFYSLSFLPEARLPRDLPNPDSFLQPPTFPQPG